MNIHEGKGLIINSNSNQWLQHNTEMPGYIVTRHSLIGGMRFPTMWYVRAYVQSDQSLCFWLEFSMSVKLLTEHHLECLSLKGGCTGSSESTLVKMPHCWKSCHSSIMGLLLSHVTTGTVHN